MSIRSKRRVLPPIQLVRRCLTTEERRQVLNRLLAGEEAKAVATSIGFHPISVLRLLWKTGGIRRRERPRCPLRLSRREREEVLAGACLGQSIRSIARQLGRAPSTVSRELRRNGGRRQYRAWYADECASRRARRPKPMKLATCPELRSEVERLLGKLYSPEQISERLEHEYPEDTAMRVSHETIYRSLFIQGRGALKKELVRYLRTGRPHRSPRTRKRPADRFGTMLSISERPPEEGDRAVPGAWEGDLLVGKSQSAIATLVERKTRFVVLVALPDGRNAESVRIALTKKILALPEELRRSLTWDRGTEMAQHARFTVDTDVKVYFCDPHSPWQRGTNENTNGLLRQYLPKGTDLRLYTQHELDQIAASLNDRPRQTLGWLKPCEAFARAVAMTV
ncbi:MAG: IS30 family transposase [Myxococcaceae bacterium]